MVLVRNLNQRQNVKLLLGTRPSGSGRIDASSSVRFDAPQVLRFPKLERVAAQSVRALAFEVLGPDACSACSRISWRFCGHAAGNSCRGSADRAWRHIASFAGQ